VNKSLYKPKEGRGRGRGERAGKRGEGG